MISYRQAAYAETTKKSYASHLKCYNNFCTLVGIQPLPMSANNVCRYAAYLAGVKNLSPNSIPKYLNIIRLLHKEYGFPNPMEENWFLSHLLMGIKKVHGEQVKRKLPITPQILFQIRNHLDLQAPVNTVFWAACVIMFFGLLRKSNVLAHNPFSPTKHLCRSDFFVHPWGLHMDIRWTKTNQTQREVLAIPLPSLPGHPLCPTQAVINCLNAVPAAKPNDPALCYIKNEKLQPLYYREFLQLLKTTLGQLGYNATEYAGHSFRRGGASWALTNDIPGEMIQILGSWKSDAYKLYFDIPLSVKASHVNTLLNNIKC